MPKNVLTGVPIISAEPMDATISPVNVDVSHLDNISIQINVDYDSVGPTGNVIISGSNDHKEYFGVVENEGNFIELDTKALNGSTSGSFLYSYPAFGMAYMRVEFTSTHTNTVTAVCLANTSNALNNKYFLIDNAPGAGIDPSASFYIWFNSAGTGVDPALPGRTGIEVAIANNDTDAAVATAVQDAINGNASDFLNAAATLESVAIDMQHAGGGSIEAGTSGFDVSSNGSDGTLSVYASAKAV